MSTSMGTVYLVGAGPGDPGLFTVRGLEVLKRAQVVVYDRLVSDRIVAQSPTGAEMVYAGKGPKGHAMEQDEINRVLVSKARDGLAVVRLKGGDPFVFGRGGEEAEALAEAGVPFEVVPGITAAVAVPAYAGIPLTHRTMSSSFAVITGREDPSKEWSRIRWDKLAGGVGTLVILMGVESLGKTLAKLRDHGLSGDTPAATIEWGTAPRQRTVQGTLDDIERRAREAGLEAPAVTVVGQVASLRDRLRWFDTRPLFGKRVLVTRSRAQASALSRRLEALGAEALEVPTIEIRPPTDWAPLDAAVGRLSEFDWIVFTSVNAVDSVFDRIQDAGLDARALAGTRLCAIGPATASALQRHGLGADFVPDAYTTAGLSEGLGEVELARSRVLLPRADIAPDDLVRDLEGQGAIVEQVTAYRTVAPAASRALARDALGQRRVDLATFTSSSTVENLARLLGEEAQELLAPVTVACIGPVTAQTAQRLGLRVDITATVHTIPGLVDAILAACGGREEV